MRLCLFHYITSHWTDYYVMLRFFRSVYAISAFLLASWPHPCLAVARYAFASDVTNLLRTNTNLP